jgi:hypothetical protein
MLTIPDGVALTSVKKIQVSSAGTAQRIWIVSGANGENVIQADGATETEAWQRAFEQADSLGMMGEMILGPDSIEGTGCASGKPFGEDQLRAFAGKATDPDLKWLIAEVYRLRAVLKSHGVRIDFPPEGDPAKKVE